jgi:hypothetical protein
MSKFIKLSEPIKTILRKKKGKWMNRLQELSEEFPKLTFIEMKEKSKVLFKEL